MLNANLYGLAFVRRQLKNKRNGSSQHHGLQIKLMFKKNLLLPLIISFLNLSTAVLRVFLLARYETRFLSPFDVLGFLGTDSELKNESFIIVYRDNQPKFLKLDYTSFVSHEICFRIEYHTIFGPAYERPSLYLKWKCRNKFCLILTSPSEEIIDNDLLKQASQQNSMPESAAMNML